MRIYRICERRKNKSNSNKPPILGIERVKKYKYLGIRLDEY